MSGERLSPSGYLRFLYRRAQMRFWLLRNDPALTGLALLAICCVLAALAVILIAVR